MIAGAFIDTLAILTALKTAVAAIQLPASYSSIPDYPKAFTTVAIYDREDLFKAFEDLFIYEDRVCLVVPTGDTYDNVRAGTVNETRRTLELVTLAADRNYSPGTGALVGEANVNPGIVALNDLLVKSLFGSNLGISGVSLLPISGDRLHLQNKELSNNPGRDCWAQTFNTTAGRMKASIIR